MAIDSPVRRLLAVSSAFVMFVVLSVLHVEVSEAEGPYDPGSTGYDISFPQCGRTLPSEPPFVIIGVNGGRPWTANECFGAQLEWARSRSRQVSLYVNTANPGPTDRRWNQPGPRPCQVPLASDDVGCAYNYGWNAAQDAVAIADRETGGSRSMYWWLDVETMNRWVGSTEANAAILVAFVDYLTTQGISGIGIYSTGLQWKTITGGHQFPGAPNWVAGASNAHDAPRMCDASFSGGPVWLVQYVANNLDHNFVCAAASPPPPPPAPTAEATPTPVARARGTDILGQLRTVMGRVHPLLERD